MDKPKLRDKLLDTVLYPIDKLEYFIADRWLKKFWRNQVPEKHKDGNKIYWGDWILEMYLNQK